MPTATITQPAPNVTIHWAHRTGADIGPVVEVSAYRRNRGFVTEFWVINQVWLLESTWLAMGVRLRADGTVDRRHISPRGGMTARPLPAGRDRYRLTGDYHRPDVTWGRA